MAEVDAHLTILTLDCRGLFNKRDLVKYLLIQQHPYVVLLQKTYLDHPLEFPCYRSLHLLARRAARGGLSRGLSTYLKSTLKSSVLQNTQTETSEHQEITMYTPNSKLHIFNLYAALTRDPDAYPIPLLYDSLRQVEPVVIAGDFNIHAPSLTHPTTRLDRINQIKRLTPWAKTMAKYVNMPDRSKRFFKCYKQPVGEYGVPLTSLCPRTYLRRYDSACLTLIKHILSPSIRCRNTQVLNELHMVRPSVIQRLK